MARTTVAAIAAALLVVWLAAPRAQTPAAQDIMPALLAEVRGLRAAMEQMAAAGPRVQLALGRLQLQEQRLSTAVRRLDETRQRLAGTQQAVADAQEQLVSFEQAAKDMPPAAVVAKGQGEQVTPEQIEGIQRELRRSIERNNVDVQRLIAEEATLAAEVGNEQARWTELNQRLEELERSLAPQR